MMKRHELPSDQGQLVSTKQTFAALSASFRFPPKIEVCIGY